MGVSPAPLQALAMPHLAGCIQIVLEYLHTISLEPEGHIFNTKMTELLPFWVQTDGITPLSASPYIENNSNAEGSTEAANVVERMA